MNSLSFTIFFEWRSINYKFNNLRILHKFKFKIVLTKYVPILYCIYNRYIVSLTHILLFYIDLWRCSSSTFEFEFEVFVRVRIWKIICSSSKKISVRRKSGQYPIEEQFLAEFGFKNKNKIQKQVSKNRRKITAPIFLILEFL